MTDILFVVSEEGYWAEECLVPLKVLKTEGYDVTVATPTGGEPLVDESSLDPEELTDEDLDVEELIDLHQHDDDLNNPVTIQQAAEEDWAAVVYPGGHGAVFDINTDAHARQLLRDTLEGGRHALILCHAVGILGFARDRNNGMLVEDRTVTGFPNDWENEIVDGNECLPNGVKLPYRIEDEVQAAGGHWNAQLEEEESVIIDGRLITARGPESSRNAVDALLDELA